MKNFRELVLSLGYQQNWTLFESLRSISTLITSVGVLLARKQKKNTKNLKIGGFKATYVMYSQSDYSVRQI